MIKGGDLLFKKKSCLYIIIIILCIIAIILNINMSGEKEKKNTISKNDNVIEITIATSWCGNDTKAQALEKIINDFEKKNKNIKINDRSRENDSFLFTLKTDFAQGNDPDIFGLWPGSDIMKLINAHKVMDLTAILNSDMKWKKNFSEDSLKENVIDNKIYGVPIEIIYEGLFINKDIFERYNIAVPTTYDELKTAVKQLRAHNIIPIAYNTTSEGSYLYQNIMMKLAGKEIIENPKKSGKMNDAYVKGMYYMKELYDMQAFPNNLFVLDDKGRNNLFLKKQAAMIVQGSWFIGDGAVSMDDSTVDVVRFPSFKDGKADDSAIVYGFGNGDFHISRKAYNDPKKRNACVKFLKYLTSEEAGDLIVNSSGSISNISTVQRDMISHIVLKGENLTKESKELVGPPDSYVQRTTWDNIMIKNFPDMLKGKMKPEDIVKEME